MRASRCRVNRDTIDKSGTLRVPAGTASFYSLGIEIDVSVTIGIHTQWRIQDSRWGGGGMDLQCGHFLVKMYVKMKELGPIGEGVHPACPSP